MGDTASMIDTAKILATEATPTQTRRFVAQSGALQCIGPSYAGLHLMQNHSSSAHAPGYNSETTTLVLIMRAINLICSFIIFASGIVFSAEKKDELLVMRQQFIAECQSEMEDGFKNSPPERYAPGTNHVYKWMLGIDRVPEYCTCIVDKINILEVPEMMTKDEAAFRFGPASQKCTIEKLISPNGGFCNAFREDMKTALLPHKLDESKFNAFCACVQNSFSNIKSSIYDPTARYLINQNLQSSVKQCGILDLKE
ncbi:hypothetical protein UNDYM_4069 [Undibacterium sp. YM2]|uniref:hypothetical protein n=1 Tax=Undibacterium sp. YM2 TaxID=2058625 RepID=UPI001331F0D8|nr:hypothetical protein [Undibacterium sp. YM2]BBB68322.1 hypothetical protein UNDYM_4069 [Undibacterium sp. YM2]